MLSDGQEILEGRFIIQKKLGSGAFGEIYKGKTRHSWQAWAFIRTSQLDRGSERGLSKLKFPIISRFSNDLFSPFCEQLRRRRQNSSMLPKL